MLAPLSPGPFRVASAVRWAVAALVCAALVLPATASADAELLVPLGSGVTGPAGVARTPDGAIWVADPVRGICRVAFGSTPGPVETPYCGPAEGQHAAPVKPTGLAFDAQTNMFYASDGASAGGAVWRMHWNQASGELEAPARIAALPTDRVDALALGPETAVPGARDLYFVTKRAAAVMRLAGAAGAPQQPVAVGLAQSPGPLAIAHLDGAIYLAEPTGVTRLIPAPDGDGTAVPVPALMGGVPTSLAVDASRHRLYIGTTEPGLRDRIDVLDGTTGEAEPYETGFTGVTALGVEPGGEMLAADDPALAAGAIDSLDQGRLWRVALQPLHRPVVRVTQQAPAMGSSRSATFAYASRVGATFECRLDDAAFSACPGTGDGSTTYGRLAEGAHRFTVRAVDGVAGVRVVRTFVVDLTPPRVKITPPRGPFVASAAAPVIQFWADEDWVVFTCSLDGGAFLPCQPGHPLEGLTPGRHLLRVVAVDPAGNTGDPSASDASLAFEVVGPPQPPAAAAHSPTPQRPAAGGGPAPRSTQAEDVTSHVARPLLRPFRLRPVRMPQWRIGTGARLMLMELQAPANAAFVWLAVRDERRRIVLTRTARVRPAARNRVAVRLSGSERRRLRPGLYLVTAVLSAQPGVTGNPQTHWLRVLPRLATAGRT